MTNERINELLSEHKEAMDGLAKLGQEYAVVSDFQQEQGCLLGMISCSLQVNTALIAELVKRTPEPK